MPFEPLLQVDTAGHFKDVRLIATDMDGTLTTHGQFSRQLLESLETLANAGFQVLIVTGRSAGWVNGLAHYLPIWGAIAENGGLLYTHAPTLKPLLVPIANLGWHRQQLAQVFQQIQAQFPQLQESNDNQFRLTDWTFEVAGLAVEQIQAIDRLCQSLGWGFTYSNVQCHIKLLKQNKADGLLQVLSRYFPKYAAKQIVTVGDSPNDESLFEATKFPCSVGVANVAYYRDRLKHQPAYVTTASEGAGFVELANFLLNSHVETEIK